MTTRPRPRAAATLAVAVLAVTTGALVGTASATTTAVATPPPWQQAGNSLNDPDRIGSLTFFDSSGDQIFSGSVDDTPFAAYAVGSTALRAGDTKATLFAYLPNSGAAAGAWSGEQLTAASTYPNADAPAGVSSTLPVVTLAAGDLTLANAVTTYPNPSTDDGFQGVYELRLRTSKAGLPIGATYDAADIQVTGTSWQVVYPTTLATTTTTLTALPASGAAAGGSVTLTATLDPTSAAGTVQFADGATALGAPVVLSSGVATKTVTFTTAGTHQLTATYAPSGTSGDASSVGPLPYSVAKAATTLAATWSTAKPTYGKTFTVKTSVSAHGIVPTGTVTLKYGTKTLTSHALSAGQATLTVAATALTPGSRTVTLSYGGSANAFSTSLTKALTVAKAASSTKDALNAAHVTKTKHAKLTVTVSATGTIPAGTIKVYNGSKLIKTVTLTSSAKGKLVITLPLITGLGAHEIHATYSGSSLVAASTGAKVKLTVT